MLNLIELAKRENIKPEALISRTKNMLEDQLTDSFMGGGMNPDELRNSIAELRTVTSENNGKPSLSEHLIMGRISLNEFVGLAQKA